jgi:hypothetical protein
MKCFFSLLFLLINLANVTGQSPVELQLIKQEDAEQLVPKLLHSSEMKDQAWGAYLIGKHQLREFVPALREKLLLKIPSVSQHEIQMHRVIVDTLILLEAQISAADFVPLYKKFPNETLILLAKAPEQNRQVLLSLFEQTENCSQWLPLGTLLASAKTPELALALLQRLRLDVKIFVTNSKEVGGTGYRLGYPGAIHIFPKDFPPIAFYDFTFVAQQDSFVFAKGRNSIYYERNVYGPNKGRPLGENELCPYFSINSYRLEFLADLLNVNSKDLGLRAPQLETIIWRGERHCQREFERIKLKLERLHRQLIRRLIKANLLTAQSAKNLQPNIAFEYFDYRKNQTIPLPKI